MAQEKSAEKSSVQERLQNLRLKRQLTWEELAKLLDLTPSMLYQVKRGDRNLGDMALYRLSMAEVDAGIRWQTTEEEDFTRHSVDAWLDRLLERLSREEILLVLSDVITAASQRLRVLANERGQEQSKEDTIKPKVKQVGRGKSK